MSGTLLYRFPSHMLCIPLVPSLSPVFLLRLICPLVLSSFGRCSGSLKDQIPPHLVDDHLQNFFFWGGVFWVCLVCWCDLVLKVYASWRNRKKTGLLIHLSAMWKVAALCFPHQGSCLGCLPHQSEWELCCFFCGVFVRLLLMTRWWRKVKCSIVILRVHHSGRLDSTRCSHL